MDRQLVERITRKVGRQFPEMNAKQPTVHRQSGSDSNYELIYKGKAALPGGRTINRVVRVIASEKGKVIRMSTSK